MQSWTFYPAFLGTITSVASWTAFALRHHNKQNPLTLSELAVARESLAYYRAVLWICGPLFAITTYAFIASRITHGLALTLAWTLTFVCEMLVGVLPPREKLIRIHNMIAFFMAVGMVTMTYIFFWSLQGAGRNVEVVLALLISALGLLFVFDKKHLIHYELPFLYTSHISILVAALSLAH